jgi:hypothetical protein
MPDLEHDKQNVMAFCDLMFNQCHPREAIERCAGEQYIQHNQVSLMARKGSSRISRKPVAITRVAAGSGGVCQRWGHRHPGRLSELRQAHGGTRLA